MCLHIFFQNLSILPVKIRRPNLAHQKFDEININRQLQTHIFKTLWKLIYKLQQILPMREFNRNNHPERGELIKLPFIERPRHDTTFIIRPIAFTCSHKMWLLLVYQTWTTDSLLEILIWVLFISTSCNLGLLKLNVQGPFNWPIKTGSFV